MSRETHLELREAVIRTCRSMNDRGINQGTSGNVSVRISGGFLITPSGVPYETLSPPQIVEMDIEGGYYGELLPSSEWRMHHAIYGRKAEAGAVVHAHASFCTSLACLRVGIPAFHYMVAVAGGSDIRCADYATFGTKALSDNMTVALEGRRACLLANHGMICHGRDLDDALGLAGELETLAAQYWHARQAGEPVLLDDREMSVVVEKFRTYGRSPRELDAAELAELDAPPRRDGR